MATLQPAAPTEDGWAPEMDRGATVAGPAAHVWVPEPSETSIPPEPGRKKASQWFVSKRHQNVMLILCGCVQLTSAFFSISSVMNVRFQDHCCCHRCFVLGWEDGSYHQIQKPCRGILQFWIILNDHRGLTPATASEQKQQADNNPVWKSNTSARISTFS